ncbi:hypothetical protein C9374_006492 [Naegleria lovaniensis]|uniref:Uncharacterized protein n=1 Tax=Naegleria lovaniensis TaxID=51637 RepID=A0AA88GMX4_NAELO|nr:uncharacterized protein C9374_006492 [Naegleria lovaniensis]KAG2381503.1 hypothetical protein C9374_006492 [Naegleria lovaniensis]
MKNTIEIYLNPISTDHNNSEDLFMILTLKCINVTIREQLREDKFHLEETEQLLMQSHTPADIVCVIDKSGSMSGEKITLVKDTLDFVIGALGPKDRLSIVSFDDEFFTNLKLTSMNMDGRRRGSISVENMRTGGITFLSGGLLRGIEEMNAIPKHARNPSRSLLLFTDGMANKGITNTSLLIQAIRDPTKDYSIHTFGYGEEHDSNMLSALAEEGNGMYYYVKDQASISKCMVDCIGGILTSQKRNVKLTLTSDTMHSSHVQILQVFGPHELSLDGNSFSVCYNDLQMEEEKHIVIRAKRKLSNVNNHLANSQNLDNLQIRVQLSMNDIQNNYEMETIEKIVQADQSSLDSHSKLRCHLSRQQAVQTLKEAKEYLSTLGHPLNGACNILKNGLEHIHSQHVLGIDPSLNSPHDALTLYIFHTLQNILAECENSNSSFNVLSRMNSLYYELLYERSVSDPTVDQSTHPSTVIHQTLPRKFYAYRMANRTKFMKCHNCGSDQHFSRNCNKAEMCHNCKQIGHLVNQCPFPQKCHHCGSFEHLSRQCTAMICFKCKQVGHRANECTLLVQASGGNHFNPNGKDRNDRSSHERNDSSHRGKKQGRNDHHIGNSSTRH